MTLVYDPELFAPIVESLTSSQRVLDELPADLPQLDGHFLNVLPTSVLVARTVSSFEFMERAVSNNVRARSGYNWPTIEAVVVKRFPEHLNVNAEVIEPVMLSGIFGFQMTEVSGKPPKLEVLLRAASKIGVMAKIGYFDLGRPDRLRQKKREYPFMNESGTLGYDLALCTARIAMSRFDRNVNINEFND